MKYFCGCIVDLGTQSLSVRRAWIEIEISAPDLDEVDESLSVRRAWIEMVLLVRVLRFELVALREESVD